MAANERMLESLRNALPSASLTWVHGGLFGAERRSASVKITNDLVEEARAMQVETQTPSAAVRLILRVQKCSVRNLGNT